MLVLGTSALHIVYLRHALSNHCMTGRFLSTRMCLEHVVMRPKGWQVVVNFYCKCLRLVTWFIFTSCRLCTNVL